MTLDFFNINPNVIYNHIFRLPPSLHLQHEDSFQLLSSVNRIEEEFGLETAQDTSDSDPHSSGICKSSQSTHSTASYLQKFCSVGV